MSKEQYQPTPEDYKKADETMDEEQKIMSKAHEEGYLLGKESKIKNEEQEDFKYEKSSHLGIAAEKAKREMDALEGDNTKELIKNWQNFYQEIFGINPDFSKLKIPEKQKGFNRLIIVAKNMNIQRIFEKCQEVFQVEVGVGIGDVNQYIKNIDSERNSKNDPYAIWIKDSFEPDPELDNISADDIKKKGVITLTMEEGLISDLERFYKEKEHIFKEAFRDLYAGSRDNEGNIPCKILDYEKMIISAENHDYTQKNLVARRVIA